MASSSHPWEGLFRLADAVRAREEGEEHPHVKGASFGEDLLCPTEKLRRAMLDCHLVECNKNCQPPGGVVYMEELINALRMGIEQLQLRQAVGRTSEVSTNYRSEFSLRREDHIPQDSLHALYLTAPRPPSHVVGGHVAMESPRSRLNRTRKVWEPPSRAISVDAEY